MFQEDDEHALIGSDVWVISANNSKSEDGLRSCPQPRRKNKHSFLRDPSPLAKRFRDASPFGRKKFWNSTRRSVEPVLIYTEPPFSYDHTSSPADSISRLFRRFRGGGGGNEYADLNDYAVCDEYGEEAFEMRETEPKMTTMKKNEQKEGVRGELG